MGRGVGGRGWGLKKKAEWVQVHTVCNMARSSGSCRLSSCCFFFGAGAKGMLKLSWYCCCIAVLNPSVDLRSHTPLRAQPYPPHGRAKPPSWLSHTPPHGSATPPSWRSNTPLTAQPFPPSWLSHPPCPPPPLPASWLSAVILLCTKQVQSPYFSYHFH